MFERFDDPEPVCTRPVVEDLMHEAKRRTVRRVGAASTCLVLMFGTAFAANRYFRTEQTVRIQEAAARGSNAQHSSGGDHSNPKPRVPGAPNHSKPGRGNAGGTNPGSPSAPAGGSPTNQGNGGDSTGNTFTTAATNGNTPPVTTTGGSGGGTSGGSGGGNGGGGNENPPPVTGLQWSAHADKTQTVSAENAFVDVTLTVTNAGPGASSFSIKECDPSCKRVLDVGNGQITPDFKASEGGPPVTVTLQAGETFSYTEHVRMYTGASFLSPGHYELVMYGTSVPIEIIPS
jgi:hypothetical protein